MNQMNQMNFNMGMNFNYGNYGNYGGYGNFGMNFGYGNMNSMMGGMLYGGFGMPGMGGFGMPGMGGYGGFMGMNGSMNLPIYQYNRGDAWDTTLATSLGRRDPVYLDTNRDGKLNVERLNTPLSFDMNGDGIMDQVHEWNTKDAQLVFDANGDGQINNGREMMNEVGLNGEQGKYKNGWEKALDIFDTNKDGKLDAKELEKARFWTDANGDGKVDEGELKTAAELGIININPEKGKFTQREQIGNMGLNFGMGMGFGNYGFNPYGGGFNPHGGGFNPYGGGFNPHGGGFNPYGGGFNPYGGGFNPSMNFGMPGFGMPGTGGVPTYLDPYFNMGNSFGFSPFTQYGGGLSAGFGSTGFDILAQLQYMR